MSTARDRECNACGALPGDPCLTTRGKESLTEHAARTRPAKRDYQRRALPTSVINPVENR